MIDRRGLIGGGVALAAAAGLPLRALAADGPVINHIVLENGRVWIAAMVNGKGPFFFILDTGGELSFIEDATAKQMGLEKVTGRPMVGVGGKVAYYSWYSAKEVRLASGTRFADMLFTGVGKRLDKDAVGSFGAGMFTTYDSDLDFVKGEWRAYPDGRPDFEGLTKLASRMPDARGALRPRADATIDGFEGEFLVDTGAPGVSLNGRAAAKSGLWDSDKPYAPMMAYGIGDGGGTPSRIYRAGNIQLGPFAFPDMLVTLNKPGALTGGSGDEGTLGLALLEQLHLSTDVSTRTLYATPNGRPAPKQGYPLSGLWLDDVKDRVTVTDVGNGSPAALAGVRKGDVLLGGDRSAMIRTINGGPGKPVALKIERGGVQQDISYTLQPWF